MITKKQIEQRVGWFQKQGLDVGLDSAYGQLRITNRTESKGYGPRGATSLNSAVLDGIAAGINVERKRIQSQTAFMAFLKQNKDLPEVAAMLETLEYCF